MWMGGTLLVQHLGVCQVVHTLLNGACQTPISSALVSMALVKPLT
jgi:hypothetical protein